MYDTLGKAKAILSEHMTSYVILAVSPDSPNTLQVRTDNRFAATGMLERAIDIFRENVVDEGWEIVWDTNDEDNEETDL